MHRLTVQLVLRVSKQQNAQTLDEEDALLRAEIILKKIQVSRLVPCEVTPLTFFVREKGDNTSSQVSCGDQMGGKRENTSHGNTH